MTPPVLEDMPIGPLTVYRKQASFDWKQMKFFFEDPEYYKIKLHIWNTLKKDPLFDKNDTSTMGDLELKKRAALQYRQMSKYNNFLPRDIAKYPYVEKFKLMMSVNEATSCYDSDLSIKTAIGSYLIRTALNSMGTEKHEKLFNAIWERHLIAAVSLTEVAHGSNMKQMRTTATYDKETQEFVIHTPDFQAAKCWIGNLAKTCVATLLFAQLYTQGQCYGLHGFLVPLRDPDTMLPYPGILIGDVGSKNGLPGVDNGWLMLNNYRIPRDHLLDRMATVTSDGDYESNFGDPGQLLSAGLENLSAARMGIIQDSANSLIIGTTIAVRYAGVRKQFGPTKEEVPILEYQLHQWRLFPYVAAAAVSKTFSNEFLKDYLQVIIDTQSTSKLEQANELVSEIHAIVSAGKPLLTWITLDALQECRAACGGHGYLSAARLGEMRNNRDVGVTYEGDNNVLVQQTSNWLLQQWRRILGGEKHTSHLGSATYLADPSEVLGRRFVGQTVEEVFERKFLRNSFEWLIAYLVNVTHKKQQDLINQGSCNFNARSNTQVYKAHVLSRVYGEYQVVRYFWQKVDTASSEMRPVLENLGSMFCLWCLEKHFAYFYQGEYASGPEMVTLVKDGILELCARLKPEVMGVIDAMAPPDFVHNSILGKADGRIYDHLQLQFFSNAESMMRPTWWNEIIADDAPNIRSVSKL